MHKVEARSQLTQRPRPSSLYAAVGNAWESHNCTIKGSTYSSHALNAWWILTLWLSQFVSSYKQRNNNRTCFFFFTFCCFCTHFFVFPPVGNVFQFVLRFIGLDFSYQLGHGAAMPFPDNTIYSTPACAFSDDQRMGADSRPARSNTCVSDNWGLYSIRHTDKTYFHDNNSTLYFYIMKY